MSAALALALACAALLESACALPSFGPWARDEFYLGLCHTQHIGYRTRKILQSPEVLIPSRRQNHDLIISDMCKYKGMDLAGVVVTVCDADARPEVKLSSVRKGVVHRLSHSRSAATCYIKQYCS